MNGYSSHTYSCVNAAGERFWVKYHFKSDQGIKNLIADDAYPCASAAGLKFEKLRQLQNDVLAAH